MRVSVLVVKVIGIVVATGCVNKGCQARSSAPVLGPAGWSVVVRRGPSEVALDVTRMLAQRGFALIDQRPHGTGGLQLRFKGGQRTVRSGEEVLELGSPAKANPCEERRKRQLAHALRVKDMQQRAIAYAGVQKAMAECE